MQYQCVTDARMDRQKDRRNCSISFALYSRTSHDVDVDGFYERSSLPLCPPRLSTTNTISCQYSFFITSLRLPFPYNGALKFIL